MASVYLRPDSGFYWVKYRDPATGKIRQESTGYRKDDPEGGRKANKRRAQLAVLESSAPRVTNGERWKEWAIPYLEGRYKGTGSYDNVMKSARDVMAFLEEFKVYTPRLLTYSIASQFMEWRMTTKKLGRINHNTAKMRFIYLRVLAGEALRRGYAEGNPCREVKIPSGPIKQKALITREDQAKIEKLLENAPQWMREQWLILMRQGCRIAETIVPMHRIDTDRMTIELRLKRGTMHTTALHSDLLPLVALARSEKRETLIEPPPSYNAAWNCWLKKHGFPYSPHCTRVTVITRLLMANHSPAKVCAFIGHSEEVNRLYRRLTAPDVRGMLDVLS